jgi:argininosuccinate synthase
MIRALMPDARIVAPMREHNMTRSEEIAYAREHGVPIAQTAEKIWSIDENLWGRSIEGGRLEEPNYAPPEEIFRWTADPLKAPDQPRILRITFEEGVPAAVDGERIEPVELVRRVNQIAGEHGVGRVDIMEDRMLGLKCRENYECPGAVTLLTAHKALEALVLTADEIRFKASVDREWGRLAYAGLWFDPLKDDLDAFIRATQRRVSGTVNLQLYKGHAKVVGRESEWALYSEDMVSFDTKTFDQRLSEGNVRTHGLQARMFLNLTTSHRGIAGRTEMPSLAPKGEELP